MNYLTTKQSDTDQLIHYLQGNSEVILSPKLEELLKRYESCADLIKQWGSRHKVVPILMKRFGISTAQAYRDFSDCQEIFGSTPRSSKDFYLDILLGNITETRNKALLKQDFKTVAACDKNMLFTIQEYFQDESIPWEKLQPQNIVMGWFPELSKVEIPDNWQEIVSKMVEKKKRNVTALSVTDVEDENNNPTG